MKVEREYAAGIIDMFEDFLESKGVNIENPEKTGDEGEAIIFGSDFDELMDGITRVAGGYGIEIAEIYGPLHDKEMNMMEEDLYDRIRDMPHLKECIYSEVRTEHVAEDIKSQLMQDDIGEKYGRDFSDEEISAIIDNAAERYVYNGDYDCNLSYWDNIDNLIDEEAKNIMEEERTKEGDYGDYD